MTDLARSSVDAAVDETVDHESHANAAADRHDKQVGKTTAGTEQLLGDGEGVDVVVDKNRQREPLGQELDQVEMGPFQERRVGDPTGERVDRARNTNTDPEESTAIHAGRLKRSANRLFEQVGDRVRVGCMAARHHRDAERRCSQVRDGRHQIVAGDLDPDHVPGGRIDAHDRRRPADSAPCRRSGRLEVLEEIAIGQEGRGDRRDSRWREARRSGLWQPGKARRFRARG